MYCSNPSALTSVLNFAATAAAVCLSLVVPVCVCVPLQSVPPCAEGVWCGSAGGV